jgi:putative FmdB family regulatory protein
MPLYEYQCDACGHRFEVIQKFSDPLVESCPVCGKPVRKLLSSPAIQFKGSGWYITDYARKGSTDSGKSEGGGSKASKAAAGESAKPESGGESKPAGTSSADSTPASSSGTPPKASS